MNVLKDEKNTVRRIVQLRLEELAWSRIAKILGIDQESARRYFDKYIENIEPVRTEKHSVKRILPNSPHLSAFGIQYEYGYFLIMQGIPSRMNAQRKTKKAIEKLLTINTKHQFTRCVQLYLEGLNTTEISDILDLKRDRVNGLLADKEFYKTYGSVIPTTYKTIPFEEIQTIPNEYGKHVLYQRFQKKSVQENIVFYSLQA